MPFKLTTVVTNNCVSVEYRGCHVIWPTYMNFGLCLAALYFCCLCLLVCRELIFVPAKFVIWVSDRLRICDNIIMATYMS